MIPDAGNFANIHGSCVAVAGRGLLILGPSGAGKSALALQIMALGGQLVADDRVELTRQGDDVIARCPVALRGLIEARGLGLLRAETLEAAPVALVADLAQAETTRLPEPRQIKLLGLPVALALRGGGDHFAYGLLQYLRGGRAA